MSAGAVLLVLGQAIRDFIRMSILGLKPNAIMNFTRLAVHSGWSYCHGTVAWRYIDPFLPICTPYVLLAERALWLGPAGNRPHCRHRAHHHRSQLWVSLPIAVKEVSRDN